MIVVRLDGGLGNQMFQYAAGRALADRLAATLELDLRYLQAYRGEGTVHRYRLGAYPIRAKVSGPGALAARGFFRSPGLREWTRRLGLLRGDLVREKGFAFQELTAQPERVTYLDGYWQSWKYFEGDRARILQDLTLHPGGTGPGLVGPKAGLYRKMASENSVCLHVRLGDYVRSKSVSQVHGNMTGAYYRGALQRVRKMGGRLRFYLFSDEPEEALKLLPQGSKVRVMDPDQDMPQEDLWLMSACKYFVTANSSFSWWGAWLSQRAGKRVMVPRRWFADQGKDTKDLIPEGWVKL